VNAETLRDLIDQYSKHGWQLRKAILASNTDRAIITLLRSEYPAIDIRDDEQSALWFSRRSLPDREAWELRRLSETPFALVTVIEDSLDHAAKTAQLDATFQQMFDVPRPEPTGH